MIIYVAGFWILLLVLTALAWIGRDRKNTVWGAMSEPEVGVATLLVVAAISTVVLRAPYATRFNGLDGAMLSIDVGLVVGLTFYGLKSGRWWTLSAAALQLVSATAHLAKATTPGMWRLGYQVMEEASSYPTLLLLAWGVWSRRRGARSAMRSRSCCGTRALPRGNPR